MEVGDHRTCSNERWAVFPSGAFRNRSPSVVSAKIQPGGAGLTLPPRREVDEENGKQKGKQMEAIPPPQGEADEVTSNKMRKKMEATQAS